MLYVIVFVSHLKGVSKRVSPSSVVHLYYMQIGVTIPGRVQAFSSYPGRLHSGDDYYLIGSKLVGNVKKKCLLGLDISISDCIRH